MNPRVTTIVVGTIILILGLAGLFYPDRVMGLLGFLPANASHAAAVFGEVRATYGGIFVVMGVFTLLAARDPAAQRGRLLFIGLMWLGACSGRLLSVSIDGNPGVPGWVTAVFELFMGGALLSAALMSSAEPSAASAPSFTAPPPPATT